MSDLSAQSSWFTALLDATQAGPRRRKWTANMIGFGEFLPIGFGGAGFYAAIHHIPMNTPWLVGIGVLVGLLVALTKSLKFALDLREKEQKRRLEASLEEAKKQTSDQLSSAAIAASLKVYGHWKTVARHHEDGMDNANRQLQPAMKFNSHEYAETNAINSYLKAIIAVFDAIYEDRDSEFSANLVVPSADRQHLHLVKIEPGGAGRSNPIPREIDLSNDAWGAAVAFKSRRVVYTEDVREHGNSGERGYLSVVNLPVFGSSGEVVAIVNVDSPSAQAFGGEESVKEANSYCRPICSSLALCLSDPRLFREQRQ